MTTSSNRSSREFCWREFKRCFGAAGLKALRSKKSCASAACTSTPRPGRWPWTAARSHCPAMNENCSSIWPRTRAKSNRAKCCSSNSMDANTTASTECWTFAFRICVENSATRPIRRSGSRRSGATVTYSFPTRGEMTRHFLGLYLLIVVTLAAVSWGQDRLLQSYGTQEAAEDKSLVLAMTILENQLRGVPTDEWKSVVTAAAAKTGVDMELFATADITGPKTLDALGRGKIANMRASGGASWALKQLDAAHVLAVEYIEPETQRGLLEWTLTLLFYAAIGLVIMIWIWPLTRDLRVLEKAAAQFGNRNWKFDGDIKPHSQIYPLAETFRKMAARIDGLIASHQDMSNAVSHEIKTPLARMQFEIELAQQTDGQADVKNALRNIKNDITAINDLVTATLDYAILERAELTLNIGAHNFTALIPGIVDAVRRDMPPEIRVDCDVQSDADKVNCDVHLIEAVLKNLLYNANRYG